MKHPAPSPHITCLSDSPGISVPVSDSRPGIDLAEWYPKVHGHVPTPRTAILGLDEHATNMIRLIGVGDEEEDPVRDAALDGLVRQLGVETAYHGIQGAGGVFLRTGYTSAKHGWEDTCHVKRGADWARHIVALAEISDMHDLPVDTWVLREMLPVIPMFTAFHGRMPITREFRYFIEDGKVLGWQPYWPPAAIEDADPDAIDWLPLLRSANISPPAEVDRLTALSATVAKLVPGAWSVDWLHTSGKGWMLIDMAWAERSYVWPGCPTLGDAAKWATAA